MKNIIARSTFSASYENLETIRQFVELNGEEYGIEAGDMYALIWSITEIVTNVIDHGYKGQDGIVEVILSRDDRDFIIEIIDDAPVFDPGLAPEPDINLPLESRPAGGLGLYMTKRMVDSFSHKITKEGGNRITIIKQDIIRQLPLEDK